MTKITYLVQYQPLRRGAARPEDWGSCHSYEATSAGLLPNVGDYVHLIPVNASDGYLNLSGKVRSRLFRQFTRYDEPENENPAEVTVAVNIVVEEDDEDWGLLIKE